MTLREFQELLAAHPDSLFRLELPGGGRVPVSFHVTEVGLVRKTFIDCGGTLRELAACQLQVWVGDDEDHRLEARKMAGILRKASGFLTEPELPVEMEYEAGVLTQYTVPEWKAGEDGVVLRLRAKHTECLAPELCGVRRPAGAGEADGSMPDDKNPRAAGKTVRSRFSLAGAESAARCAPGGRCC